MSIRLVLFDIDGTLIVSGRAGMRGMNRAFLQLYGRPNALEGVPIAGRTDRAIVMEVLRELGRDPDDTEIARLRDAYIDCLREEIVLPVDLPSTVLPGVGDLLDALAARHVPVGLLTGNFVGGAAVKLSHFSLWPRFGFGAYGDDHVDRRALVPIALQQALSRGVAVAASDVAIIGDTPLDVDCALAHGAHAIGVTTGPFDRASLSAAGADLVVDSLADTAGLMEWLAAPRRARR
jgi:phosphoglycolate phosphatase-like HAD superfamily hydrolase